MVDGEPLKKRERWRPFFECVEGQKVDPTLWAGFLTDLQRFEEDVLLVENSPRQLAMRMRASIGGDDDDDDSRSPERSEKIEQGKMAAARERGRRDGVTLEWAGLGPDDEVEEPATAPVLAAAADAASAAVTDTMDAAGLAVGAAGVVAVDASKTARRQFRKRTASARALAAAAVGTVGAAGDGIASVASTSGGAVGRRSGRLSGRLSGISSGGGTETLPAPILEQEEPPRSPRRVRGTMRSDYTPSFDGAVAAMAGESFELLGGVSAPTQSVVVPVIHSLF